MLIATTEGVVDAEKFGRSLFISQKVAASDDCLKESIKMSNGVVRQASTGYADGTSPSYRLSSRGELILVDLYTDLLGEGRVFCSSDADENDRVTGQTSFAATTPTFLLRVPSGTTAIPLQVRASQAGTVAGGVIYVDISFDRVDRYSSSGTSEAVTHMNTARPVSAACTLYSGATASAATEARLLYSLQLEPDTSVGAATDSLTGNKIDPSDLTWGIKTHAVPYLVGPAALLVFTYAGTTGPTWEWSVIWAEIPSTAD